LVDTFPNLPELATPSFVAASTNQDFPPGFAMLLSKSTLLVARDSSP
jgi:hypothetical protein